MLPVIIIIVLLAAAIACLLLKSGVASKALTLVALGAGVAISVMMITDTLQGGSYTGTFGSGTWALVWKVGVIESFMACIFTGIGFLIMWASTTMIEHDVKEDKIPLYYSLICALIALLCGVVFFENFMNIFIFIEFSSFAAAGIVIIKNEKENVRAGLKYLTLSILGSGLVLMGIVILYSAAGGESMTLSGVHAGLMASGDKSKHILNALIFITGGICFKSALFPFHIWLPDAHGTAPSPSSAVLSSLVLKAYIIFYIKTLYVAVGQDMLQQGGVATLMSIVLVMGVIAMLAGSIMAILQTDIKRMIAYSSVAQIGYIFMGIGLGNYLGLVAAVFHIMAHAVTKSGLFLVAGSIIEQTHNRRLDKMGGLGLIMPVTMALFTVGALSMVGIPLFVGFNSKWNFAMGILDSGSVWVMIALAISSLLNALYYLPVVIRAFFGQEAQDIKKAGAISVERPIVALLPIIILAVGVIVTALSSNAIVDAIKLGVNGIW